MGAYELTCTESISAGYFFADFLKYFFLRSKEVNLHFFMILAAYISVYLFIRHRFLGRSTSGGSNDNSSTVKTAEVVGLVTLVVAVAAMAGECLTTVISSSASGHGTISDDQCHRCTLRLAHHRAFHASLSFALLLL